MAERRIEIPLSEGSCDAVICYPDGTGEWPGVVFFTDIGGVRAANIDLAKRLAAQGYSVLIPNVFYRTAQTPLTPLRSLGEEAQKKRMAELTQPLTPEAMERDASAYVDFLAGQDSLQSGMMGVVGYCFTGKMAMHAAAARSEKVTAMASFHGGGLYTDTPASPHLLLPRIKARLYFAHATKDRSMPEEAIAKLEAALKAGAAAMKAKLMKTHFTAGQPRTVRSTTRRRPSARSRSWSRCLRKRCSRNSAARHEDLESVFSSSASHSSASSLVLNVGRSRWENDLRCS